MTCTNCTTALTAKHWGGYDFACVQCCARLVLSAHPNKALAAGHLAAIARFPQSPKRAAVLQCVSQMKAR